MWLDIWGPRLEWRENQQESAPLTKEVRRNKVRAQCPREDLSDATKYLQSACIHMADVKGKKSRAQSSVTVVRTSNLTIIYYDNLELHSGVRFAKLEFCLAIRSSLSATLNSQVHTQCLVYNFTRLSVSCWGNLQHSGYPHDSTQYYIQVGV
jgi:hypothetical protein